jgi:hypothetical protein
MDESAEERKANNTRQQLKKWVLVLAALSVSIGFVFPNFEIVAKDFIIGGSLLAFGVFIFEQRFRLLIAIIGIMGFNIWLISKGLDGLEHINMSKEAALILAVAILAWLSVSCYVLSLLRDTQSEDD